MVWRLCKNQDGNWSIFEDEHCKGSEDFSFLSGRAETAFSFESKGELEEWVKAQKIKRLKKEALTLLVRRDHSSRELMAKLEKKGGSRQDAQSVIEELQESNIVQDADYLERSIMREFHQGYGPKMIAWRLAAKKFSREAIEEEMRRLLPQSLQQQQAESLAKKFAQKKGASRQKIAAAIFRRGFSSEIISKIRMPGVAGKGDDVADVFHAGDE